MQKSEAAELREMVIEAARHVFPGCGVPVGEVFEPAGDVVGPRQLVAFIGFTGDVVRGTLALVAPVELMRGAYPLSLKNRTQWEFEVFDWSGEVANRVLARIKDGLTRRGVEIEVSTPRVMLGDQLHVATSVRGTIFSASFRVKESWIKVWFDAIAPEEGTILSPLRPSMMPPEGDVLLF